MEVGIVEKETEAVVGEEVAITSSTSKWWSSRRLLGERLYYELYLQVVEFEAQTTEQSSLTKTWTAGINCKINHLLCNVFIFNV